MNHQPTPSPISPRTDSALRRATLWLFALCGLGWLLGACANPGSGPDGGPFDETPPKVIATSPAIGQTNVKNKRKLVLHFSEAIKVDNPSQNIVVSPPQVRPPEFKLRGRHIDVELKDKLKDNTTYTIDFSDAITDYTEGNPLGNFTYYFSTGPQVDTLEMSGKVLDAEYLNPVKGILVGLYSNLSDTAFTHLPFERVGRTDDGGQFSIKGIAPGKYHIFALKDRDGDFRYSQGEQMAFLDSVFVPSFYTDVRYDTVWVDSTHYDSIRTINYTHFTPDNIILRAFQRIPVFHSLKQIVRPTPEVFTAYFSAPNPTLPVLKGLNFDAKDAFLIHTSTHADTIVYWIKDPAIRAMDTLRMAYTYERTNDSTQIVSAHTDTLDIVPRITNARLEKERVRDSIKWAKNLERRHKKGDFTQEQPPVPMLKVSIAHSSGLTPIENIYLTSEEPIVRLDTAAIQLYQKVDSTFTPVKRKVVPRGLMGFEIMGEWRLGNEYRLDIDSAAIEGLLGHVNGALQQKISIVKENEVGSLFITMPQADDHTVVQLLQSEKKMVRQDYLKDQRVNFYYLKPATYYIRCYLDKNNNGKWDTGDYEKGIEPEEVYYYHEPITVRANWDIDQVWNLYDLPLDKQKPTQLQKSAQAKTKRTNGHQRNIERLKSKGKLNTPAK